MEILNHKLVVTRKKHYCFACLRNYEPKSKLYSTTCVDSGDCWTNYTCETCNELITSHRELFSDDNYFEEGCVNETLKDKPYQGYTPETLLEQLNKTL